MTFFAVVALVGCVPAVVVLFAFLPARKAAATALIAAWLLLPPLGIDIPGLPDFTKLSAASLGVLFGTLFFGIGHVFAFRPRWFDLPVALWCVCGIASSLSNGLGLYDGLAVTLRQLLYWGLPYFFGRLYFCDLKSLRLLTSAMVVGGLSYVLPCLWEIRMSPVFMGYVYGFSTWQGARYGGFRPYVFFKTGLELGMWMTAASLAAWWLWRCGVLKKFGPFSFGKTALPVLLVTTILCRSFGALVLLLVGVFLLWASTRFKTKILLWALVFVAPVYFAVRIPNLWTGDELVEFIDRYIDPTRAESLAFRFKCENVLVVKAAQQPVFGWAGWGRSAVYWDESGDKNNILNTVPTDGLWIIAFGLYGYVGLTLLYFVIELPLILFLRRFPVQLWNHPQLAPASLAAILLGIYMVDCLVNAFINIIYVSLAGGLISVVPAQLAIRPRKARDRASSGQGIALDFCDNDGSSPPPIPLAILSKVGLADRYRRLGRASKEGGQLQEARVAWQQALEIFTSLLPYDRDNLDLRRRRCDCANDLAWLLVCHPDPALHDPASAVALACEVVKECSDCGVYWNTLGVAYFRAGDYSSAIVALERASELGGGGNPFDLVFMAMAQARLGNTEHARHLLDRTINSKEQGHAELDRFCDEARSILAVFPDATAITS